MQKKDDAEQNLWNSFTTYCDELLQGNPIQAGLTILGWGILLGMFAAIIGGIFS